MPIVAWGDEQQIEVKPSAGVDLSRPLAVAHHLYFFEEGRSLAGCDFLRREGFSVVAEFFPDRDPPEWEVVATRDELVAVDQMRSLRSTMEKLTEPNDEYDGWDIAPVRGHS